MKRLSIVLIFSMVSIIAVFSMPRPSRGEVEGAIVDTVAGGLVGDAMGGPAGWAFGAMDVGIYAATGKTVGSALVDNVNNPKTQKMNDYINKNGGWYGISGKAAMKILDNSWENERRGAPRGGSARPHEL